MRWMLALLLFAVSGCGSATSPAASVTPPTTPGAYSAVCGGCQAAMGNTCIKVVGAAVDRPGVTVARLCEPWCCQVTASEWGDVGFATYSRPEPWSSCPTTAMSRSGTGTLGGSITEGATYHVPRATVVVAGKGETVAAVSDEYGTFEFPDLTPGHYTLAVYYGDVVFKKARQLGDGVNLSTFVV